VTVKLEKCTWGTDEGSMLGHKVKCGLGIQADSDKIDHMGSMELTDRQTLKSFLGSAVYLAKFVKDYAELTGPLYDLESDLPTPESMIVKSGPLRNWFDRHERSFRTIKAALASAPVLAFPDLARPFIIISDCNKRQAGGVLMQLDKDGNERVIAYWSKRLNKTQQRWGITSKEGYAAVSCCRKWRSYIHGHPTVLVTDHKALLSLRTKSEFDTERLARYSAELMELDLSIAYRPGRFCHMADLMSRGNIPQDAEERERLTQELLQWKAKQDLDVERDAGPPGKHGDDRIGEDPWCGDAHPAYQSRAQRALEGDEKAYSQENIDKHIKKLIRGATFEGGEENSCESVKERVEQITEAMRLGEHAPQYGTSDEVEEDPEEDPLIIQAYDAVCASLGWAPLGGKGLKMSELAEAQKEDSRWQPRVQAVARGWSEDKEVQGWLERHENQFVIKDDVLHRAWIKGEGRTAKVVWQVVVPGKFEAQLLEEAHTSGRGSHYGTLRTFAALRDNYYIEGLFMKVQELIKKCEICRRYGNKPPQVKRKFGLRSDIPGECWVIDVLHLTKAKNGYEYVLTMIDVATRWGIAQPIRLKKAGSLTAEDSALCVLEQWSKLGTHITPRRVCHDGGSEFKAGFEDMCDLLMESRHVSVARRAYGHGAVERYNRDITQLVAKMCPEDKVDELWPWVLPSAVEAHNAALHTPNAAGSIASTPSEMMYGVTPVLNILDEEKARVQFEDMKPGSRDHMERVFEARKTAIQHVKSARETYMKKLVDSYRNITRVDRTFSQGQIVRITEKRDESQKKKKKLKTTLTVKCVVVKAEGYGRYQLQKLGEEEADIEERHADDITAEGSTREEAEMAQHQAQKAADGLIEWEVEEILDERGSKKKGTKEYLIKYANTVEPSWQPHEDIDDECEALIEFKGKKVSAATGRRSKGKSKTVKLNLLEILRHPDTAMEKIYSECGVTREDTLYVNAGVPCRTFSIARHSNKGRVSKDNPTGHGFNCRNSDEFRTPCCSEEAGCKYGDEARLHDELAKGTKETFEFEKMRNPDFNFGIENPEHGDLLRRDYMRDEQWKVKQRKVGADMCAFKGRYKAPKVLITSLMGYQPRGSTGNGRCNNGQCGQGEVNDATGCFVHHGKLARSPIDGPRGHGALREKNHYPEDWSMEIIKQAIREGRSSAKVVIDLFSGWQSLKPICEALGLTYIGIDIMGG